MHESEKQRIRRELSTRRLALSALEVQAAARAVVPRLLEREELSRSSRLGIYWAHRGELPTAELFRGLRARGHSVYLPKVEEDRLLFAALESEAELSPGRFGILEPRSPSRLVEARELDALILPGLAFDIAGRRIGWGHGYYDRALRGYAGFRVGLAYDFQVLESLPWEAHDEGVQALVTETRSFLASPGG